MEQQVSFEGLDGVLSAIVWPTYVGAVRTDGAEPMSDPEYQRGSITWRNEGDEIVGSATINCPAGEWSWLIYCYGPEKPQFVSSQKLAFPVQTGPDGFIRIERITKADFDIENQALRTKGLMLPD